MVIARKTFGFTNEGLSRLPNNRPVACKILTEGGRNNYTGIAKRGRVQDRLQEHLLGGRDYIPGAEVQIEQMNSIEEARQEEQRVISRSEPPYNKQGS